MPFAQIIRRQAQDRPDHPAIRWAGGELTYAEVHERTNRLAQALSAAGIGRGDRIAILDTNNPAHLELAFATAKIRAVPVPINFRLAQPEIAGILADCEAKLIFVGAAFADTVAAIAPRPAEVIGFGPEYEAWLGEHPATDPGLQHEDDDTVYQLYSSGTTGKPKGVEITGRGLKHFMAIFPRQYLVDADTVNAVSVPIFHIGGNGITFATHDEGGTNYIVSDYTPEALVDLLERERCTHAGLVPVQIQMMLALPGVEQRDFGALRAFAYGGSPISDTLMARAYETFDCSLVQGYGLTESTGGVTTLAAEDHVPGGPHPERLRSVGQPNPGVEIRIVDPTALVDVPQGEVGEVWIRTEQVMKGYWHAPELTAETLVDGWLRSGDAGYFHADGYLYLHDRIKDMIVSGAENIYPAEIENALASHPAVAESAVIAVPSERWGETPKALVVLREDHEVSEAELIAHCRERIAAYKCPTSVDWVDTLPRNPSGKVLKRELRAPYWRDRERVAS